MPDYSLIPSLTVTQDQRGDAFNAGVGDANTSELGAFFEGFTRTAANTTSLRTAQLAQAAEYDPARLAAEQAKRELEAQRIAEQVRELQIENQFGVARQQANLIESAARVTRSEVLNRGTEAETRKTGIETDILQEFGREEAASLIQQRRASAAASFAAAENTRVDTANDILFGKDERRAKLDSERISAAKDLAELRKELLGESAVKEELDALNTMAQIVSRTSPGASKTDKYTDQIEKERSRIQKRVDAFAGTGDAFKAEREAAQAQLEEFGKKYPPITERSQYSIPSPSQLAAQKEGELSTDQAVRANILSGLQNIQKKQQAVQTGQQAEKVRMVDEQLSRILEQTTLSRDVAAVLSNKGQAIKQTLSATDGAGNRDVEPVLSELFQVDSLWEKDPANREKASRILQETFQELGGTQKMIYQIESDPTIPADQKQALKRSIYKAAIHAGDESNFGNIQQSMMKLGLGEKEITDPEKSLEDVEKLLSNAPTKVSSNEIKALQFHPSNYFALARKASKNNTQPFTVFSDATSVDGSAAGETGPGDGSAQTQQIVTFRGADGTVFQGAAPQDEASLAFIDILQTVAEKSAGSLAASRDTQTRQQTLESAVQKRDTFDLNGAAPPPPAQEQPKPKNYSQNFNAVVEKDLQTFIAQWQAKNPGKKLPNQLRENWRKRIIEALQKKEQQQN